MTRTVIDGEWYMPKMNNMIERCCNCGLVHLVDYKVVKTEKRGDKYEFWEVDDPSLRVMTNSFNMGVDNGSWNQYNEA